MCLSTVQAARNTAVSNHISESEMFVASVKKELYLQVGQLRDVTTEPGRLQVRETVPSLRIFKTVNLKNFTNNFQLFQTGERTKLAIDNVFKVLFNKEKVS